MLPTLVLVGAALGFAALVRQWTLAFQQALQASPADGPPVPFTVLVPARDEEEHITPLLQDLAAQVPLVPDEVIVVDDGSSDGTPARVRAMAMRWRAVRLLPLQGAQGKKAALEAGVGSATHPVVLFTDADVRCGPGRLHAFGRAWAAVRPDLLLGPVFLRGGDGLLGRYQREEQAMLLGIAAGSALAGHALLANGANLAVRRSAFIGMGGYAADRRWASGDDMFLLRRVQRAGARVAFVADPAAAVEVCAAPDLHAWWSQRLRWAGKLRAYPAPAALVFGLLSTGLPWALAFTTLLALHLRVGEGIWWTWTMLLLAWGAWTAPAVALVRVAKMAQGLPHTPVATILAMCWMAFTAPVITCTSLVVRPRWKGRRA